MLFRSLQIIGDVLDFSKIEAGKLEINPVPVDLRLFVRDCIHNFLAMASAKDLALDCSVDERVGAAHLADPLRLRQILGNFLSNAIKFTERGHVHVRLERLAVQEQRELLALRVTDTGIGISEQDQGRLFQPFEQTSDGAARYQDSTGLGLSICRRLAELMGGEITLESQLGVGTTLTLALRLAPADPALIKRAATVAKPATRIAPSITEAEREGTLILLADDHPTNRAVIKRQINQLGYACECAIDGDAALQLWKSGRFGLVLTDLHMPRRDGYALAVAVREDEQRNARRHTPIIALSATISAEGVERSRAAGIDDFLAKPATLAVLANALQRYLPLPGFQSDTASALITANPILDRELLDDFLNSTREDLAALSAAYAKSDATAIAHEAHRIRGASALVEATALAACAGRIEAAARANDMAPIKADIAELTVQVSKFAAANSI